MPLKRQSLLFAVPLDPYFCEGEVKSCHLLFPASSRVAPAFDYGRYTPCCSVQNDLLLTHAPLPHRAEALVLRGRGGWGIAVSERQANGEIEGIAKLQCVELSEQAVLECGKGGT